MSPEAAFLQAVLPDPVVVLGQHLDRYSLGAEMLLRRFDNYFSPQQRPAYADEDLEGQLFSAVFIVASPFEEARRMLHSRDLSKLFRQWRKNLPSKLDLLTEAVRLKGFIADGRSIPGHKPVERKGAKASGFKAGATQPAVLLNHLQTQAGLGLSAYDVHYSLAAWMYLVYWEEKGAVRIYSESDHNEAAAVRSAAAKAGLRLMNARDLGL